jgi:hypothetical protein
MPDSLLVAVAGGAVGSVLTLAGRYSAVPSEVRHHDRQIAEIDRDLDRFAADEYARLRNVELPELLDSRMKMNLTADGGNGMGSKARAKLWSLKLSWSMQLYRDHENGQLAKYQDIIASEGRVHWLYRRLGQHPIATLETPALAAAFLDCWKKIKIASNESAHMPDPRTRSIELAMTMLAAEAKQPEPESSTSTA